MTTTKGAYTPGPWEYFEQKEWGIDATYGAVRQKSTGLIIVDGCAPGHSDEQKTNARLIAAAPDLYEACKAALTYIPDSGDDWSLIYKLMWKAVKKAGGISHENQ